MSKFKRIELPTSAPAPLPTVSTPRALSAAELRTLFRTADEAGKAAVGANFFDMDEHTYPCGFANIVLKPNRGLPAKIFLEMFNARPHHAGGLTFYVHAYGQSMNCKETYAHAFADVVKAAGLNCYAESRMD